MLTFETTLEPKYFKQFTCIGSACEDSCCTGWGVNIDKATFDNYQQCQDKQLKPMFQKYIIPQNQCNNPSDIAYAQMEMDQNCRCPFFAEDGLCNIQRTLGEEALSITCDTYPRNYNHIDSILERSLSVSCPSAAELILLNEMPMQFDRIETPIPVRNHKTPFLNTAINESNKPYRYFQEIRSFIISVLQNRNYPLWERLVMLSLFCSQLDQVSEAHYDEDIPYLIQTFTSKIESGEFREPMHHAESQSEVQLQIMSILINHRLQGSFVNERFLTSVQTFREGIGALDDTAEVSQDMFHLQYDEAYTKYYQPFMEKHEYILENYLVNYVFKNLFPFRAQKDTLFEQQSVYSEYVLMVLHYSIIKTLLIGHAGYYQKDFSIEHVTKLIQTFGKAVEHNLPFLQQAVQFIETCNMNNTSGMMVLIKN